jgi:hypothetical protein
LKIEQSLFILQLLIQPNQTKKIVTLTSPYECIGWDVRQIRTDKLGMPRQDVCVLVFNTRSYLAKKIIQSPDFIIRKLVMSHAYIFGISPSAEGAEEVVEGALTLFSGKADDFYMNITEALSKASEAVVKSMAYNCSSFFASPTRVPVRFNQTAKFLNCTAEIWNGGGVVHSIDDIWELSAATDISTCSKLLMDLFPSLFEQTCGGPEHPSSFNKNFGMIVAGMFIVTLYVCAVTSLPEALWSCQEKIKNASIFRKKAGKAVDEKSPLLDP